MIDKMVVAIVDGDLVNQVVDALVDGGIQVTEISSQGGFLKKGNSTLLIGLDLDRQAYMEGVLEDICQDKGDGSYGAHLFYLDLEGGSWI